MGSFYEDWYMALFRLRWHLDAWAEWCPDDPRVPEAVTFMLGHRGFKALAQDPQLLMRYLTRVDAATEMAYLANVVRGSDLALRAALVGEATLLLLKALPEREPVPVGLAGELIDDLEGQVEY